MSASRKGIFARNIFSNFAGYGVAAVSAFVLTPFLQDVLGRDFWLMWAVIVSLTGSYSLLDLGIRSAVGQYVTRYWSQGDMAGVNRTLNTAMVILLGVAAAAALVTLALFFSLEHWVDEFDEFSADEQSDLRWALLISGLGIALGLPMALWATVTYARERFEISNAIGIGETLLRTGLTFALLSAGGGIVTLALVTAGTQLLSWSGRMLVAYRLMPDLRWSLALFDRGSVRELATFGGYNVLVNAADKVVLATDLVIITAVVKPAGVFYASGALLPPYFMQMILMVTWTMTPYATACDAKGEHDKLRSLFLNGTRGSLYLAVVIGTGLLLTGDAFLHQWLKVEVLDSPDYASAGLILSILVWATLIRASSSCGRQILFGKRRMPLLAGLSLAEAILNLGLSIVLIHFIGTTGVALGTLIPVVLLYGLGQNLYLIKLLDTGIANFLGQVLRASVPVMLGMYATHLWVDSWLVIDSWFELGIKIALLCIPAVLLGYLVVMNRDERRKLHQGLLRRRTPEST